MEAPYSIYPGAQLGIVYICGCCRGTLLTGTASTSMVSRFRLGPPCSPDSEPPHLQDHASPRRGLIYELHGSYPTLVRRRSLILTPILGHPPPRRYSCRVPTRFLRQRREASRCFLGEMGAENGSRSEAHPAIWWRDRQRKIPPDAG